MNRIIAVVIGIMLSIMFAIPVMSMEKKTSFRKLTGKFPMKIEACINSAIVGHEHEEMAVAMIERYASMHGSKVCDKKGVEEHLKKEFFNMRPENFQGGD